VKNAFEDIFKKSSLHSFPLIICKWKSADQQIKIKTIAFFIWS